MLQEKPGENLWCKHAEMILADLYFIVTGHLLARFFFIFHCFHANDTSCQRPLLKCTAPFPKNGGLEYSTWSFGMSIFGKWQCLSLGLCALVMVAGSTLAQAESVPKFKQGEDYAKVRIKLLNAGWKPRRMPDADQCMQGDDRCQGRPEMEACAGSGRANCRFAWQRAGALLTIFTVGSPAVFEAASNE